MSWENREYILSIGEKADVRRSFFGMSVSVIYAGMTSEAVYSLAITLASGYIGQAYNLFLPAASRKVKLPHGYLVVSEVSAEQIRFRFEG